MKLSKIQSLLHGRSKSSIARATGVTRYRLERLEREKSLPKGFPPDDLKKVVDYLNSTYCST